MSLSKEKVNPNQVKLMETLGFEFNSFDSSDYNAFWDFYIFVSRKNKLLYRESFYPHLDPMDLPTDGKLIIQKMCEAYYKSGQNDVRGQIKQALELK